jgi:hypothetical protein
MNVAAWLQSLGLERYEPLFRDNEIDWEVLPKLTSEDLKEIGVVAIGHRPAQDSVRPGYGRDVGEILAAQPMTDLAEHASLGVRKLQPTIQLHLEDAVLGGQIFVPRQQLLVHRPRHVGQDASSATNLQKASVPIFSTAIRPTAQNGTSATAGSPNELLANAPAINDTITVSDLSPALATLFLKRRYSISFVQKRL